jgi:hypothetical protein
VSSATSGDNVARQYLALATVTALFLSLATACSNHGQVTDPVCFALDAGPSQPCSTDGLRCVNPGEDPPVCTCVHAVWSCPVHHHEVEASEDVVNLTLNLDAAQVTEDAQEDAAGDAAGGDATGDAE